jgi:predicted amidohydrolase YtcJ
MMDLIFFNANVITLDPQIKTAQMVAVKDGRILTVAHDTEIKDLKQRHTQLIDCHGKTLLPGFCDAHLHLQSSASNIVNLDLSPQANVFSISDMQIKICEFSKKFPPGTWIRASGYNEFYLEDGRHPTRKDLDKAAPEHPVKLTHRSSHAHVLNSLALKQTGISRYTPEPPGGLIERNTTTGEPNGILFEMNDFLSKHIPALDESELTRGIKIINQKMLSCGITSIHDASFHNGIEQWNTLCSWKEKNIFLPRATMALGVEGFGNLKANKYSCPVGKNQIRLSTIKIILDETTGQLYPPQKKLNRLVFKIHQAGLQVAIHAIEHTAVESACNAIEHALKKIPNPNHRHRIEHCSVCSPSLARRLAALKIIVVTQPSFIHYNGDRYLKTVAKEDIPHLYPIGTLQKSGVLVVGSSDSPIVEPNPITGIYSSISRMTKTGKAVSAKESIDNLSALEMFTGNAAKAFFDEDMKGSITPGKLADLVLLSGDPTKLSSEEIKDITVVMTVLDGTIVWKSS